MRPFELAQQARRQVAEMTGQSAGSLVGPIEETLAAGVLVENGDRLAFCHDLVRRAVYEDLPAPLRPASIAGRSAATPR